MIAKKLDIEKLLSSPLLGAETPVLIPSVIGLGAAPVFGDSMDDHLSHSAEMIRKVRRAQYALFDGTGLMDRAPGSSNFRLRTEDVALLMVTDYVLGSYLGSCFSDDLIESALGRPMSMEDLDRDSFADLFGIDVKLSPARCIDYFRTNIEKDTPVLRAIRDQILRKVEDGFKLDNASHDVIASEDLDTLLTERNRKSSEAPIRFYREEWVRCQSLADRRRGAMQTASPPPVSTPSLPAMPDLGKAHKERAEALQLKVDELSDRVSLLSRSRADEESEINQLREINRSMRARLRALEAREVIQNPEGHRGEVSFPDRWEELEAFSDRHLAGRVVLSKRAIRAARGSVYRNIAFAYEVLLMLAQDYVPMRAGEPGARERYEARCQSLRVTIGPIGEAAEHAKTRLAYRVQHLGRSVSMDLHVQGSSSRDPREGFRLYFSFVQEGDLGGYVLVGSFPAHLENSLS